MAERDAAARLRRAVKENNLFLAKRLIQRVDMRNPDTASRRYTSLAWAAVLGHEVLFEFLLTAGHDDEELSKDSENNTILMLLSDTSPTTSSQFSLQQTDTMGAILRMAQMYYDRYPWILDWSNVHGKTCLHLAALKGNEELVRMLCDYGADFDLADNKGNTPLHYASSWGHIPIVQLLIERGCQYSARNNEGFTASDYAYSFSTRDTLQDSARIQFENNKKARRNVFAQAAARGSELGLAADLPLPRMDNSRVRSGSGGSRTTATSDSGDMSSSNPALSPAINGYTSMSSSPSQRSIHSGNGSFYHNSTSNPPTSLHGTFLQYSPPPPQPLPLANSSAIVSRMRERDADAREKYMRRNRSGSAGTASNSADAKSQNGSNSNYTSTGPSSNEDDISALQSFGGTAPRRRLRPSMSAAQLRASTETTSSQPSELRSRSGTNPSSSRPIPISPIPHLIRSSSTSPRSAAFRDAEIFEEPESFTGPSSQYARFPDPPAEVGSHTPTRRLGFNILTKSLSGFEPPGSPRGHRRGSSLTSNSSRAG